MNILKFEWDEEKNGSVRIFGAGYFRQGKKDYEKGTK